LKNAGAGAKTVAAAEAVDAVTDNAYVQGAIGAAEGAALGAAVGGPAGAVGGAIVGGLAGFILADGERLVPCDMVAIPAYQYSGMLQGREPTFQIYIKEGEMIAPLVQTDFMEAQQVVAAVSGVRPKRKLSKWQRYLKVKKNQIKFKSGKKKGQLNLKAMGKAYRRKN
jgi:hypothetical protein